MEWKCIFPLCKNAKIYISMRLICLPYYWINIPRFHAAITIFTRTSTCLGSWDSKGVLNNINKHKIPIIIRFHLLNIFTYLKTLLFYLLSALIYIWHFQVEYGSQEEKLLHWFKLCIQDLKKNPISTWKCHIYISMSTLPYMFNDYQNV